jgi:hypothetical protein
MPRNHGVENRYTEDDPNTKKIGKTRKRTWLSQGYQRTDIVVVDLIQEELMRTFFFHLIFFSWTAANLL